MDNMEYSVAMDEQFMEQSADDAQAAEVISAEDLAAELIAGGSEGETVVTTGDDGQTEQAHADEAKHGQQQAAKRDNQMRAALKQQRKTIFEELGESEDTVRELIRAHRAAKITEEDPEITPKAARKIVEAQEQAAQPKQDKHLADMTAAVQGLIDDGWSADELRAFAADETAQADMANGKTVRQAATAFMKRQTAPQTARRRGVPTFRSAATTGAKQGNLIDDMSDADFARLSDRAYQAAMGGKKVSF
jgi:hypothetical protein